MMGTAGSLEKGNKANREANLTHYVNLGLAEKCTLQNLNSSSLQTALAHLGICSFSNKKPLNVLYQARIQAVNSSFSHLYFDSGKNIHCIFAAAINILPV